MPTAGIIVIGNEVLSGKVEEENAKFLIGELRELGVKLMRISIIRDEIDRIAREVREMAAEYAHVFTTGGVGGTHDDVTFVGVAKAFDVPIERNKALADMILTHYKERANEHMMRMADLPRGAELVGLGELPYPLIRMKNVYVFPGVPMFLRSKFPYLRPLLRREPFVLRQIFVRVGEDQIAQIMTDVQDQHPELEIGSYPRFDTDDYKVKITVEAREKERVDAGVEKLLSLIHPSWIVRTA
jgi:molybdenum cofactor synthesis domain-containing protein